MLSENTLGDVLNEFVAPPCGGKMILLADFKLKGVKGQ